jgi:DNA polymerase-3 subunit delta'
MIIGHQKQWRFLKGMIKRRKIPHALLFSGQAKLGKKTVALEFARTLLNGNLFSHPDFIFLQPVQDQIQIFQIKDLIWRLSLKPFLAPFKIAIIDQAHLMQKDSQNCFLKTLEEPKNAILILITEYPEFLLPTILSRCQIIKFYPVNKKEIEGYLKENKIPEEKIKEISQISLGRPGVTFDFLSDPKKLEEQKKLIRELLRISNSDLASRFSFAKKLADEPNLKEILISSLFHFRNVLINSVNQEENFIKIKDILASIQETYFLISNTNINKRLALEILLMKI